MRLDTLGFFRVPTRITALGRNEFAFNALLRRSLLNIVRASAGLVAKQPS